MSNVIYYFTGTGNSLAVAKSIASQLGDTKLLKIDSRQTQKDAAEYERVGFVFPVYYYKMPVFMEEFVKNLKLASQQYLFGVATYGGARGLSLVSLRELLNSMGYSLNGEFSVLMPGNYIVQYGAFPDIFNNYLIKISDKKIKNISSSVRQKIKSEPADPRSFERLYLKGEKQERNIHNQRLGFAAKDKGFSADENCSGCGTCSAVCPVQNITMTEGKPEWNHRCEQCVACIQWCPKNSINYEDKTQKRKCYTHKDIALKEIIY